MLTAQDKLQAARRFAPPLVVTGRVDRRGASLRSVSRRAVDYTRSAGFGIEDVYPSGIRAVRAMAPPKDAPEAAAFVRASGLRETDVYPLISCVGGMQVYPKRRWRWGWVVAGVIVGAALVGPIGAAVGVVAGGLVGAAR